jgi:hypothetical protein
MFSRSLGAAVAGLVAAALATPGAVLADKVRIAAADQGAARLMVVQRIDLGPASGWSGGPVAPPPATPVNCSAFGPQKVELVLTGSAESFFRHSGLQFDSRAQVLRSDRMVRPDWQRTVAPPAAVTCLRTTFASHVPRGERLVSFGRVAFPRVGDETAAFRAVVDLTSPGHRVRLMVEVVLFTVGRAELNLTTTSALSAAASVRPAEVSLVRDMAGRATTALGAA